MAGAEALGPGAEFDAIRAMVARWGDLAVGIGDDAASLTVPRGEQLVASVDAAVEGRHFRRDWLSARDIAYRATAAALSDLAAMGARPLGVLSSLAIPEAIRPDLLEIADGIGEAVRDAGTVIRGGNITAGSELSLTTTVLGSAYAPLRRDTARVGDAVYVTGRLGGSGAALRRLEAGRDAGPFLARFARPTPRLREGRWLAREGANAAIDISDGLVGDARHLAAASAVALEIEASRIPRVDGVTIAEALESGEEYELLLTASDELDDAAFAARFGVPLTRIGRVTSGEPGAVTIAGARVANVAGHDHFSR